MDEDPYATRRAGRPPRPPATEPQPAAPAPPASPAEPAGDDPTATRVPAQDYEQEPHEPAATRVPEPERDESWAGASITTSSGSVSLPSTAVTPPVYEPPPPPGRRPGAPVMVGAALVVVAAVGFVVGFFVHQPPAAAPTKPTTTAPFLVTGVSVHLAKGKLKCPSAVAHLSATVSLDRGGGTVRYDWDLLNSTVTSPQSISVPAGDQSAVATLAYTLSGKGATTGGVRLHLLSPANVYSAPVAVRYTCSSVAKHKPVGKHKP